MPAGRTSSSHVPNVVDLRSRSPRAPPLPATSPTGRGACSPTLAWISRARLASLPCREVVLQPALLGRNLRARSRASSRKTAQTRNRARAAPRRRRPEDLGGALSRTCIGTRAAGLHRSPQRAPRRTSTLPLIARPPRGGVSASISSSFQSWDSAMGLFCSFQIPLDFILLINIFSKKPSEQLNAENNR